MRVLLAVLLVAASGCLSSSASFTSHTEVSKEVFVSQASTGHINFAPQLQSGKVLLTAFTMPNGGNLSWESEADLHYSHRHAAASAALVWVGAPLSDLMARSRGEPAEIANRIGSSSYGGGGCGGPVVTVVRVDGKTVMDNPLQDCQARRQMASQGSAQLAPGESVLFGAGACGFSAGDLQAGDSWPLDIRANAELNMVEVPATPMACGIDFESQYATNVAGVHTGDAVFTLQSSYGATFSLVAHAAIDGDWTTPEGPMAMKSAELAHTTAAGLSGFRVRAFPDHEIAFWMILGI